ncbi:MAG: pantoate--beta-alanine ligase [Candidatus Dadabacteria bacterium]|nr:pantoate--beta-alanine ligase [Candidatus Dadabacteria bacterium]
MSRVEKLSVLNCTYEMKEFSETCRKAGRKLGFVPTMGALHRGHISLMEESVKRADVTVASIFVNPTQFGPGEDFDLYERDYEGDVDKLVRCGVSHLFYPDADDIYPDGFQTTVSVGHLGDCLCGFFRPGHFDGVATVVLKLFNIVRPDFAVFGRKDYQQLRIIQRMVRDFDMDIEIVEMPIVREQDGLAMSSRNAYLSSGQRRRAVAVNRALREVREKFRSGFDDCETLVAEAGRVLRMAQINDIDYVEIRDPQTLELRHRAIGGDLVALAVRLNGTRLIDNILL